MKRDVVAWGASKLLQLYVKNVPDHPIAYIVDSHYAGPEYHGIPVKRPDALKDEVVAIFAVSTSAIKEILGLLHKKRRAIDSIMLYSDLFYPHFKNDFLRIFGRETDLALYQLAKSYSLNSVLPVHTTLLGNVLFLESLRGEGAIAEVGVFNGGNALLASQYIVKNPRPFYLFDTFEGFPVLTQDDPSHQKKGDYKIETSYEQIVDNFSPFPFVHVTKGAVPATLSGLPEEEYSLVFYDCDLYEPAKATFEYFWPRMKRGGIFLIGDYIVEEGGFVGVKKASDEFFGKELPAFWQNTMAVAIKP